MSVMRCKLYIERKKERDREGEGESSLIAVRQYCALRLSDRHFALDCTYV